MTGRRWPGIAHRAAEVGLSGDALFSERPGHLTELARDAADGGAELLVVVGGDGSLHEGANGIAQRDVELAEIARGNGSGLGSHLAIPPPIHHAVRVPPG